MLAIQLDPSNEKDRYLLARAGYGRSPENQRAYFLLCGLDGGRDEITCDPYDWPNRTRKVAHEYIIKNFEALESGAVIDVEHILGIRPEPKVSEAVEQPT